MIITFVEKVASTPPLVALVVDDDRRVADTYTEWLSDEYVVRTAYSGIGALEQLDETIDVVLLDRNIPDLSGREILREIRSRDLSCRVCMVTAVKPDFDILTMGFDEYLVKPVNSADLHRIVSQLSRLANYDRSLQRLYALASKRAALQSAKSPRELKENPEYRELLDDLEACRAQAANHFSDMDETMFKSILRDLDRPQVNN